MTREEVHNLMENELRCVQRGNYCDRDCAKCPLVKEDKELIEAYGYVIKALEQEPSRDMEEIEEVINCDADAETKCKMISNILTAKPHYFVEPQESEE